MIKINVTKTKAENKTEIENIKQEIISAGFQITVFEYESKRVRINIKDSRRNYTFYLKQNYNLGDCIKFETDNEYCFFDIQKIKNRQDALDKKLKQKETNKTISTFRESLLKSYILGKLDEYDVKYTVEPSSNHFYFLKVYLNNTQTVIFHNIPAAELREIDFDKVKCVLVDTSVTFNSLSENIKFTFSKIVKNLYGAFEKYSTEYGKIVLERKEQLEKLEIERQVNIQKITRQYRDDVEKTNTEFEKKQKQFLKSIEQNLGE